MKDYIHDNDWNMFKIFMFQIQIVPLCKTEKQQKSVNPFENLWKREFFWEDKRFC